MLVITFQLADPCNMRMEDRSMVATFGRWMPSQEQNVTDRRDTELSEMNVKNIGRFFHHCRILEMCCCCCCYLHHCVLEQLYCR